MVLLQEYEHIEVCGKILFQIELLKSEKDADFGMAVEAELAEDADEEDELCVFISDLAKNGLALRKGAAHAGAVEIMLCFLPFG